MLPEPPKPPRTPKAGAELVLLCAQLDHQRAVLLRKVAGLTEEELRSTPAPSSLSLLGLLKHAAHVERWWFRRIFAGEAVAFQWTDDDPDADFHPSPEESAEQVAAPYADEVERSRAIVAASRLEDAARAPSART